jgi:hypothetical protein
MRLFIVSSLILAGSVANARGPGALWSAIMDYYGDNSKDGYYCTWDTNPSTKFLGGWIFSLGAQRMPSDVCFSLIRLMVMRGPEMGLSMNFFGEGKITYFQASNGLRGPTIEECGTMSLKSPYDQIPEDKVDQILDLIRTKGAPAGLRELEKILNKNVALTCVTS